MWKAPLLGLLTLAIGGVAFGDDAADLKLVKGTWSVTVSIYNGKKSDVPMTVIVEDDTIVLREEGHDLKIRFRLSSGHSPKHADFRDPNPKKGEEDLKVSGIYKIDGDDFWLCVPQNGPTAPRPTAFESTAKSNLLLLKMKRSKD